MYRQADKRINEELDRLTAGNVRVFVGYIYADPGELVKRFGEYNLADVEDIILALQKLQPGCPINDILAVLQQGVPCH